MGMGCKGGPIGAPCVATGAGGTIAVEGIKGAAGGVIIIGGAYPCQGIGGGGSGASPGCCPCP